MKILICVWRLTHGGAERVASLWAQGFVAQGHSVDFFVGSHSSPITYDIPKSSTIYYETCFPDSIASRFVPKYYKDFRLKKALDKVNPDVVISIFSSYGQRVKSLLKNKQVPVIVTEHNSYERPDYAPMPRIQQEQKFRINSMFDAVTILTQVDKDYLVNKMGEVFANNTYVLPNPLTFFPKEEIGSKKKVVLAAGRLDAWHVKGLDLLIEAWGRIAKKHKDWTLEIAGDGDPSYLRSLVGKNNIENEVRFLGFVDMKKCYDTASIFVLSSRYEGFGMVLTEAMSQGCACVACDYKGRQREIIRNDNQGIICPVDDVDALVNAMEKLIVDEPYRQECQKNAIERSKYYALPNIMNQWNEIFKKLNLIR